MKRPFPIVALSIRQPWAWLIVNGWKAIENRSRRMNFRGPFLVHAAAGMTRDEYEACLLFMFGFCNPVRDIKVPPFEALERGGIVGMATALDCVDRHPSEWFTGRYGLVLTDAKPLPFMPCKGALGFFRCDYQQP